MNHLESLISEYLDWKGYLVKRNIKVGKRPAGGWEMELDIIAFNPTNQHLLHIEASLDADTWTKREHRYSKKFLAGDKYILTEVFTWLPRETAIEKIAILSSPRTSAPFLAGARIESIDAFIKRIKEDIRKHPVLARGAIPEQYPLLRTIQLVLNGHLRSL